MNEQRQHILRLCNSIEWLLLLLLLNALVTINIVHVRHVTLSIANWR